MLRFLADENFNNDILRGLLRRDSSIDVVRLQDVGLSGSDDPTVLEMAAETGRVLLTHDASTMTRHAYDRVRSSRAMPGVFEVAHGMPLGPVIDDLMLLAQYSFDGEWEGQIRYLPLR